MHLVKDNLPHRCAVIPGRAQDPEGFVKTGLVLTGVDPEIEISVEGVKQLGKVIGMVPKEVVEEARVQIAQARADLEHALAEIERLRPVAEYLERGPRLRPVPDPEPIAA